jgi:hypothetical protein
MPSDHGPVGVSLLAKNDQATRSSRQPALSSTSIASKLAPTTTLCEPHDGRFLPATTGFDPGCVKTPVIV